jgi:hypothetical protein
MALLFSSEKKNTRIMQGMLCGSLGTKSGAPCKMKMPCMWHVHHQEQEEVCPICMEVIASPVYVTNCRHQFHNDCLFKWMEKSDFCPVCRSSNDPLVKFKKTVSSAASSSSYSYIEMPQSTRGRRNRRRRRNRRNRRRMLVMMM